MKKHLLLSAILCLCNICSFSQSKHTTKGKEFWLAYMENLNLVFNGPPVFSITISSEVATTGTVELPATGFTLPFSVSAMQAVDVYLPPSILYPQGDEDVANTGIKITSNDSVNVYAWHHRRFFTDATLVVPVDEMSSSYMITAQKDDHNVNPSQMVVMATQDSTVISITPSVLTMSLRPPAIPFSITLNKGEVFQLQALDDLSGTIVASVDSTKKIVVFSGARHAYVHCADFADNHLYEMDYNAMYGNEFISLPTLNLGGDAVKILSSADSNYVTIDNGMPIYLTKGSHIDTFFTSPAFITATKPVAVSQFIKSKECNANLLGDPSMLILAPLNLLKTRAIYNNLDAPVGATAINTPYHFLNIIARTSMVSNVTLDGLLLNGFQLVPGNSQYSFLQLSVSNGMHTLYCPDGCNAFTNSYGDFNAVLYHLGFDFNELVSGISEHDMIKSMIYPDPFSDRATLSFSSTVQLKNADLLIYSAEGKMISQKKFSGNSVTIERGRMSSGLYFYVVVEEGNVMSKGKVAVE